MTQSTHFPDVYPVRWQDNQVILIDQTQLPLEYEEVAIADV